MFDAPSVREISDMQKHREKPLEPRKNMKNIQNVSKVHQSCMEFEPKAPKFHLEITEMPLSYSQLLSKQCTKKKVNLISWGGPQEIKRKNQTAGSSTM